MATKAQEWARKRNEAKWRLTGIANSINQMMLYHPLTPAELSHLDAVVDIVESVLIYWDESNGKSKRDYIKSIPLLREKK